MDNCWLYTHCNHKDCAEEFCKKRYKLDRLFEASLLAEKDKKYFSLLVDDVPNNDLEAFKRLANIEQNIDIFVKEGNNLFLHSANCGCGKTSWAIRFIKAYLNKIWASSDLCCRALFISVPKLLIELKTDFGKNSDYVKYICENIEQADIIVWDDIAAKDGTAYEIDRLFRFIDNRINTQKTNIYTTNLSANEMVQALGERLKSRICEASIDIELIGSDKRCLKQSDDTKW